MTRIIPAVPAVPITMTGIQRCCNTETAFAGDQGWSMYCGSISPPIDVPNQT